MFWNIFKLYQLSGIYVLKCSFFLLVEGNYGPFFWYIGGMLSKISGRFEILRPKGMFRIVDFVSEHFVTRTRNVKRLPRSCVGAG